MYMLCMLAFDDRGSDGIDDFVSTNVLVQFYGLVIIHDQRSIAECINKFLFSDDRIIYIITIYRHIIHKPSLKVLKYQFLL